jgi:2-oxoglutarate decarboxylase
VKWRQDLSPINRDIAYLEKQMQVATLIRAHRVRGHLIADLDPLGWQEPKMHDELDPATYGLTIWDLEREFLTGGLAGQDTMKLGKILHVLRDAYCRSIGIEYMHIQETDEQRWIQSRVEGVPFQLSNPELRHLLGRLNAAEAFEKFLATKYVGTKRFSAAADDGSAGVVLGMAHRGRLNVLANIVGKSYDQIFREFEGYVDPNSVQGSGDVKYHLGAMGKYVSQGGKDVTVELAANPSHLETVDPIVLGMVRARQDQIDPPGSYPVLPVLIHGDAAFAGQGVVAECLAMSTISGYRVGGTVHLVINNQIGFTTVAGVRPLVAVRHRRRQDDPGAHLPCERRRSRSVRSSGGAGLRVPPDVPQGRRDRHGVLPPPRPQRGRRSELHPTADVQGDREPSQRAQALHRGPGAPG